MNPMIYAAQLTGKLLPSIETVTGVIDANKCREWLYEEIHAGTDLDLLEHLKECKSYKRGHGCDCDTEGGDTLIGDWKQTWVWRLNGHDVPANTPKAKRKKVWVEDQKGASGYAAIYRSNSYVVQVSWSKWEFKDARWCSPCYPNQGSIDTWDGGVRVYILPPDMHFCFECNHPERSTVWAKGFYGAVLCDVCCERHNISPPSR